MVNVPVSILREFSLRSFQSAGIKEEDATCITDVLVESDLRGVHSHGVQNLPRYAKGFIKGMIASSVTCPLVTDTGSISIMDGQNGLGLITCNKAMELAIARAKSFGLSIVGVRNSNHFGAAAYYSMKASKEGQIGFCTTNGPAVMAPWGGSEAILSNNPFSIAIPFNDDLPIVLDMACSVVARGWIRLKARNNLPIPEGWAINRKGLATTDAREALDGTVLPVGGYKGYGIAFVNEILSSALTGALFSFEIIQSMMLGANTELGDFIQTSWKCGHIVGAIDLERILPVKDFRSRVQILYNKIKECQKASGVKEIYVPGEIENQLKKERLIGGIPLPESTIKILASFSREIGIPAIS